MKQKKIIRIYKHTLDTQSNLSLNDTKGSVEDWKCCVCPWWASEWYNEVGVQAVLGALIAGRWDTNKRGAHNARAMKQMGRQIRPAIATGHTTCAYRVTTTQPPSLPHSHHHYHYGLPSPQGTRPVPTGFQLPSHHHYHSAINAITTTEPVIPSLPPSHHHHHYHWASNTITTTESVTPSLPPSHQYHHCHSLSNTIITTQLPTASLPLKQ